MNNWNYDKAVTFVEAIQDPVSKRLTKLLLDSVVLNVSQKKDSPEGEFDLFFFVRAVSSVTCRPLLFHKVLSGEELDQGWVAIAEEIGGV